MLTGKFWYENFLKAQFEWLTIQVSSPMVLLYFIFFSSSSSSSSSIHHSSLTCVSLSSFITLIRQTSAKLFGFATFYFFHFMKKFSKLWKEVIFFILDFWFNPLVLREHNTVYFPLLFNEISFIKKKKKRKVFFLRRLGTGLFICFVIFCYLSS